MKKLTIFNETSTWSVTLPEDYQERFYPEGTRYYTGDCNEGMTIATIPNGFGFVVEDVEELEEPNVHYSTECDPSFGFDFTNIYHPSKPPCGDCSNKNAPCRSINCHFEGPVGPMGERIQKAKETVQPVFREGMKYDKKKPHPELNNQTKSENQPIVLMSRKDHIEQRIKDLDDAFSIYRKMEKDYPEEWKQEFTQLNDELLMIKQQQNGTIK